MPSIAHDSDDRKGHKSVTVGTDLQTAPSKKAFEQSLRMCSFAFLFK